MTDFIGAPRRSRALPSSKGPRDTLTMLAITAFVAASLWVGRQIFVPIACAVLLSFVLAPMVRILRRWRVGRGLSVFIVVALAFIVIFSLGAVLTRQITVLASNLAQYETTVTTKIRALRGAAANSGLISGASQLIDNFGQQLSRSPGVQSLQGAGAGVSGDGKQQPMPVIVRQPAPGPVEIIESIAASALEPLATTGIVLVFVVFILVQREDLRDRMIRLAGSQDLQRTTAAIDDAARRLSRYFLAQTSVNAAFGVMVGIGLALIGVPAAPLWGILAAIMRFVPYIGAILSAAFPIALSAAVAPGWSMTLETGALFFTAEPIMGQVVEPMLYGHSTGLSPIAVVVSATFWTWLWGPIGLILATPLTVCLVVLGRHVDQLEFLDILLGDAPPLSPVETFYQRVLAGHPMEAAEQAERLLRNVSLSDYYNDVALPGLLLAQGDIRRGTLDEERQRKLCDTIEDLVDALSDRPDREPDRPERDDQEGPASLGAEPEPVQTLRRSEHIEENAKANPGEDWRTGRAVLCVAGRSQIDRAAGLILNQLLAAHGVSAEVEDGEILAPRRIGRLDLAGVRVLCLSYFDASLNPAHVRFAIRRLRRRAPDLPILAGFWTAPDEMSEFRSLCEEANADYCAADLKVAVEVCLRLSTEPSAAEDRLVEAKTA